ncbi:MAG: histidinol phosphate phosphatase, partial [Acidobacteria bacterium]|nr:histidinol phosphate phosphatase [Acidobacteriota bacterium]
MSSEVSTYFSFMRDLQHGAGEIIRRYFGTRIEVEVKSDDSPVTRADREVELFLREEISLHYPEHSIFGEEYGETKRSGSWRWIVDPIDGTKSFVLKTPLFGTLIALECDGVPVLGSIYFAIRDQLLIGSPQTGTFLNGERCEVSTQISLNKSTMIITDPRDLLPNPGNELLIDLAREVR